VKLFIRDTSKRTSDVYIQSHFASACFGAEYGIWTEVGGRNGVTGGDFVRRSSPNIIPVIKSVRRIGGTRGTYGGGGVYKGVGV